MADDMVMFSMPDGTEVSNDPRFDLQEALARAVNSGPERGSVGPTWDEQQAQVQATRLASLQSGQPGVGENATLEDPTRDAYGPLGSPAQQLQFEDAQRARADGASPASTSVDDDEPVDSNERVLAIRESIEEDRRRYLEAVEKLGDEGAGDPDEGYGTWTGKQLKAEVARRNADENRPEEDRLKLVKGMKVADVADLLITDDEAFASADSDTSSNDDEDENEDDSEEE